MHKENRKLPFLVGVFEAFFGLAREGVGSAIRSVGFVQLCVLSWVVNMPQVNNEPAIEIIALVLLDLEIGGHVGFASDRFATIRKNEFRNTYSSV